MHTLPEAEHVSSAPGAAVMVAIMMMKSKKVDWKNKEHKTIGIYLRTSQAHTVRKRNKNSWRLQYCTRTPPALARREMTV
jgi:hypothetical protein